jgi:hypothetical protein
MAEKISLGMAKITTWWIVWVVRKKTKCSIGTGAVFIFVEMEIDIPALVVSFSGRS